MSVKNINLLNTKTSEDLTEKQRINYIQALANLGQRIGIKGDSIDHTQFTFCDCIESVVDNDTKSQCLGFIKYMDDEDANSTSKSCMFGIVERDDVGKPVSLWPTYQESVQKYTEIYTKDIFQTHQLDAELQLDVKINNVESYLAKSIMKEDQNVLCTLMIGKLPAEAYEKDYDVELQYTRYNLSTNEMMYALRLFHFENYTNPVYCLLEIDNQSGGDGVLRVYKLDTAEVEQTMMNREVISAFKKFFASESYTNELFTSDDILRMITDLDITSLEDIEANDTVFGIILDRDSVTGYRRYQVGNDIRLTYASEQNTHFQYNQEDYQKYVNTTSFNNDKYGITILNRIDYLNNDAAYLYPKLLDEFDKYYAENMQVLHRKILLSIFDRCIKEHSSQDLDKIPYDDMKCVMFVPLTQDIGYYTSSNDCFKIYDIDEVFVNILPINDYVISSEYDEKVFNTFVFSSEEVVISKTAAVSTEMQYNTMDDKIINSIHSSVSHTLPYIDPVTFDWIINDTASGVSSYINKYDKQYIMLILSGESDMTLGTIEAQMLNNLPSDFTSISFQPAEFSFNPYLVVGSQLDLTDGMMPSEIVAVTALPAVDSSNIHLYLNSLVISLTTQENIISSKINLTDDLVMCTMWKINQVTQSWEIIKDSSTENPFDLSKILNLNLAMTRYKNSSNQVYEYVGVLMESRKFHSSYSPTSNVYLIYPENATANDSNASNKLEISQKIIDNTIDISKNELLLPNDQTVQNTVNLDDEKYINFQVDPADVTSSVLVKNDKLDNSDDGNDLIVIDESTISSIDVSTISSFDNRQLTGSVIGVKSSMWENIALALAAQSASIGGANAEVQNSYDYKFNISMPVMNMSEILHSNMTIINRINIMTLDQVENGTFKQPIIYNTIIGAEQDASKKSVFVIKSTDTNINLGLKTLISAQDRSRFKKQDKFRIEFDEIELAGSQVELNTFYTSKHWFGSSEVCFKDFDLTGVINSKDSTAITHNPEDMLIPLEMELTDNAFNITYTHEMTSINQYDDENEYYGLSLINQITNDGTNTKDYNSLYEWISSNDTSVEDKVNMIQVDAVLKMTDPTPIKIGYFPEASNQKQKVVVLFIKKKYVKIAEFGVGQSNFVFVDDIKVKLIKAQGKYIFYVSSNNA